MSTDTNCTEAMVTIGQDEDTVCSHIINYLKQHKYKIISDSTAEGTESEGQIIAVAKNGLKEIIEVKGYHPDIKSKAEKEKKKSDAKQQARNWFSEALFSSFVNFGRHSRSGKVILALGLPDTVRYRAIMMQVQEYFTVNKLNLKVYLVAESGAVEVYNLNEQQK